MSAVTGTAAAPRRVFVHVGTPKTGTSFVQDILFAHREDLAAEGLLYPADRHDAHFLAALDLMDLPWGGLEREAGGRWEALAAEVRASSAHTVVVSHEILGAASSLQAARALESLGLGDPDVELHLVLSARDLPRQIPAEWQENVKHRRVATFGHFLDALRDDERSNAVAQWFWAVQELPAVLERWGGRLPREHVHVVTVPPPGSPPTLLWERFAGLFGLDPVRYSPSDRANTSLGVPEAEMLRRLNERLNDVLPGSHYRPFVRELLVHQHLSGRTGSPRLALPDDAHRWATELGRTWISDLALRGYDVVGSLDDLQGGPVRPFTDPDAVDERLVADAAVDALGLITREAARLRDVEVELHGVIEDLMGQLDRFHGTRSHQAKERLVRLAGTNVAARAGLSAYRRLRGSSSRST